MSAHEILSEIREACGNDAKGALAIEMLSFYDQYKNGDLDKDEYEFLIKEIAEVRAADELAGDEVACRWAVLAATNLLSLV